MDPRITVCEEGPRGCGYRKEGGLYLRCDGIGERCGRLPLPCAVCPCCGQGIKPARGWTWIDPRPLVDGKPCDASMDTCKACPLNGVTSRAGLLWIGEKFYPTPEAWLDEVARMGVSRRVTQAPHGFEVGKTWVLVAHRKVTIGDAEPAPAIFHAFRPSRVECVVPENETKEKIDALEKRGIVPVVVRRIGEQTGIGLDDEGDAP